MSPQDLLTEWPSQAEIARVLGVEPPSVSEWFEKGRVPEGRQYQVELASDGRLKADKPAVRLVKPLAADEATQDIPS